MFSCLIDQKTDYFSHILNYYSSSLPSLVEHTVFNEASPPEIRNFLAGSVCCNWHIACSGNVMLLHNCELFSDTNINDGINFKPFITRFRPWSL